MTNTTGIYATLTTYLDDHRVAVSASPKPSRNVERAQKRAIDGLLIIAAEKIFSGTDVSFYDDADGTATLAWVEGDQCARIVAHAGQGKKN